MQEINQRSLASLLLSFDGNGRIPADDATVALSQFNASRAVRHGSAVNRLMDGAMQHASWSVCSPALVVTLPLMGAEAMASPNDRNCNGLISGIFDSAD